MPSIIQKVDNYRATQNVDDGHLKFEKFMEYILRKAQAIFITDGTGLPSDVIFQINHLSVLVIQGSGSYFRTMRDLPLKLWILLAIPDIILNRIAKTKFT